MSKKGKQISTDIPVKPAQGGIEQPQQQLTEEQAFMMYINQLMNNTILEHENAKSVSVEAIKNIGQRLNLYMREVSKLTKENEVLRKQIDELKKK